jgi:DMSO/TMAO reductase YedYZ molybdopterin-dependent catalytic subunit
MPGKLTAEQEIQRRTRRSFLALGAGGVAAVGGFAWLYPDADADDIPRPLRSVLNLNEKVVRGTVYDNSHLVKRFPASQAKPLRVNGKIGIEAPIDLPQWRLEIVKPGETEPSARLDIDEIRELPRTEEIIDFRCVEGWSNITQFAGAKFSDFVARFAPGAEKAAYVRMVTPGNEYYVGLDMPSAMHPQTLLTWEMGGAPLELDHGAPLRLSIPVKYGIKNIKRIGRIEFTDKRPGDYWAEQGYDWFAGL